MQNNQRLTLILGLTLVALGFQNCGQSFSPVDFGEPHGKAIPIEPTSEYSKIVYDTNLSGNSLAPSDRLEVDLIAGLMVLYDESSEAECAIDSERLQALRSLLASSSVCEPAPLAPNTATCLAIGIEDIELSNEDSAMRLRTNICHSGIFLCGDDDAELRFILKDLREAPPLGCTP